MKLKANQKGFTLVELLIVIVVIAILAAISIVAYSGIQNRAKTTTGQELASQVEKKATAYYTVKGEYPSAKADFANADVEEAALEGAADSVIETTVDKSTSDGGKKISYTCTGTGSSADAAVAYWDFQKDERVSKTLGKCTN